ncbi:MAG: peptidoglycan DD-metalloendopeptidase family protein [Rhodospirillales bacterium]|nr:peptidoglycan DD-metalloendopeptidase family protein [Alphaproteobacteria bacterium]USO05369.1 MAG: peptidoglycan DD-metalloendopeptidase family protein [Rhodospirillales bacterium]
MAGLRNVLEWFWMQFCASLKSKFALYRLMPLRQRYFVTRDNRLRMRYVTSCMAVALVGLFSVLGVPGSSMALRIAEDYKIAYELGPALAVHKSELVQSVDPAHAQLQAGISSAIRQASLAIQKPEQPRYKELVVKSGDTVAGLLQEAGLSGSESHRAVKALEKYYDVRKVKSGQRIDVHFKSGDDNALQFSKLSMRLDPVKEVSVLSTDDGEFKADLNEKELFPKLYARKTRIETSLYGSAARANIPSAVIAEMIRIYSWNIDFQRDIRSGDKIEVLYEAFETEDGEFARYGNVLFASLNVGNRDYPIYRFEMDDGRVDYFEPDGISIRKTLMKTPVDGARISSGFGMRKHPVMGYSKMHKGMDFAAPTGTPIYAAGDGVVERAGRNGSFGNYVRIRHNSKLKTAYAHLHRIKSSVSKGSRVRQGQIIGYVGTTGRSTGPHLHYEVLLNGEQVNPRSVNLPTGEQLAGQQLKRFKLQQGQTHQQYVSLGQGLKFAQNRVNTQDKPKTSLQ